MATRPPETEGTLLPRSHRLQAALLIAGMVVGCLAIWTASPALWLWVGSQIDRAGPPSMGAIGVVVIGVGLTTVALGKLLAILHADYRELNGTRATIRVHLAWLRSMRGDRPHETAARDAHLTVLDFILVCSVLVALALYQYWFLFKSGSPIDLRSGRG